MKTFRLDRFLTLYFFHSLAKRNNDSNRRIPILMYHSISDESEIVHPYFRLNTAPAVFEKHMKFLHENNYRSIDLLRINRSEMQKSVIITFDDGYQDYYSTAFPILEKYGFQSTVFLSTGFIGGQFLNKKACLNWQEIRDLYKCGVSFGAHTVTHPALFNLKEGIEKEIKNSKMMIEDSLGNAVLTFSYPGKLPENKKFLEKMRNLLIQNGFKVGVSTRIGTSDEKDDSFFLKRVPVNSEDDIQLFKAKLESGYDWLYKVQKIYKKVRN